MGISSRSLAERALSRATTSTRPRNKKYVREAAAAVARMEKSSKIKVVAQQFLQDSIDAKEAANYIVQLLRQPCIVAHY